MSIIHEALKKAAQIKKDMQASQLQNETKPSGQDNKITAINTAKNQKTRSALPVALPLLAILIAASVYLTNNNFLIKSPPINTPIAHVSNAPNTRENPADNFVLTGIVYEDKEPMAVINGSIYTVGEVVSGAEVIEITNKRALLKKDNNIIELKVK